jgi:hypothetical protein
VCRGSAGLKLEILRSHGRQLRKKRQERIKVFARKLAEEFGEVDALNDGCARVPCLL